MAWGFLYRELVTEGEGHFRRKSPCFTGVVSSMALDVELLSEGREFDLKEPGDMALGGTGGGGMSVWFI